MLLLLSDDNDDDNAGCDDDGGVIVVLCVDVNRVCFNCCRFELSKGFWLSIFCRLLRPKLLLAHLMMIEADRAISYAACKLVLAFSCF